MSNESHINKIISHLASAATTAADGVGCAVKAAGQVVNDQYDRLKLNMDMTRLQQEQEKLFTEIGRCMYNLQAGKFETEATTEEGKAIDAQQEVDQLLQVADEKQQEIDLTAEKLHKLSGVAVCPNCAKVVDKEDTFCSACGEKLPEIVEEPEETEEPVTEVVEPEVVEKPEEEPKAKK